MYHNTQGSDIRNSTFVSFLEYSYLPKNHQHVVTPYYDATAEPSSCSQYDSDGKKGIKVDKLKSDDGKRTKNKQLLRIDLTVKVTA